MTRAPLDSADATPATAAQPTWPEEAETIRAVKEIYERQS
jgi:hypothetical protein